MVGYCLKPECWGGLCPAVDLCAYDDIPIALMHCRAMSVIITRSGGLRVFSSQYLLSISTRFYKKVPNKIAISKTLVKFDSSCDPYKGDDETMRITKAIQVLLLSKIYVLPSSKTRILRPSWSRTGRTANMFWLKMFCSLLGMRPSYCLWCFTLKL